MRRHRHLATLALLALIPIIPYALLGYAGQDLPFHLSSWLDLRDGWLTGRLAPGWSAAANFGLGDPHLTLYPPVSMYLGGLLALVLPLGVAPAAFVWLCVFLSGLAMYSVGGEFLPERDRLPAAALYILSPYLLATALVRFAAAELLVTAWLPFVVLFLHRTLWPRALEAAPLRSRARPTVLLALLLALTWITDIPAAIVLAYGLFTAALACACLQRSARPLLHLALANALALALAAFYLAPALTERNWISASALTRANPGLLLLFMPQSGLPSIVRNSPLVFACWLFLCVQAFILITFATRQGAWVPHVSLLRRGAPTTSLAPPQARMATLATLALAAVLFELPLAYPLWRYLPELPFVQFPFRFLALLGVVLPLLLFMPRLDESPLTFPRPGRRRACVAVASLSLIALLGYLSMTGLADRRIPPLAAFAAAGATAPEYLPAGATRPNAPLHLEPAEPVPSASADSCTAYPAQISPNLRAFRIRAAAPCRLRIALFFYPYWRAFDETHHPLPITRDPNGLLLVDIPAGDHLIALAFHPESPVRTASEILSILALTLTAVLLLVRPFHRAG
jgi:hypothetical protein